MDPSLYAIRRRITFAFSIIVSTTSCHDALVAYNVSAPIGGMIVFGFPIAYSLQKPLNCLHILFSNHFALELLSVSKDRR